MLNRITALLIATLLSVSVVQAQVENQAQVNSGATKSVITDHAESWFVSNRQALEPGEVTTFMLYQQLEDHWHVYWENPGDSGLPLELKWSLPEGFIISDIDYPMPKRLPVGPFVNYGHDGTPGFLIDVKAPDDLVPGTVVTIEVKADWLICEDICVPESASFTLEMPVVAQAATVNEAWAATFAQVEQTIPQGTKHVGTYFVMDGKPGLEIPNVVYGEEFYFFERKVNIIEPSAPQVLRETTTGNSVLLFEPGFEFDADTLETLEGILEVAPGEGVWLPVMKGDAPELIQLETAPLTDEIIQPENQTGLGGFLILAFIGGIILNIMPCVFPVIFIKAASLAQAAQESPGTVRRHGLLYTAGVLLAFAAIAGLLLALRAGGAELGWGFHLQSPGPNAIFALIIFLIGLNLAGLFELGTSLQGVGSGLAAKSGNAGAFFTGLLAVAVAAPCIGPLLGPPVGFALNPANPPLSGMAIFLMMGLGLALPYLLLSLVPALSKLLPKPGAWMNTFKQFLSFAMFATLVWLAWVITGQAGENGVLRLGVAMVLAAFAAWTFGKSQRGDGKAWLVLAIVAISASVWTGSTIKTAPQSQDYAFVAPGEGDPETLPKMAWSPAKLAELRAQNVPVFIDFTAKWCVTCQVNKVTVLQRADIARLFNDKGAVMLVADWTSYDPEITQALEKYGRAGVPLYIYYAPGSQQAIILPQVLSVELMQKTFSAL